MRELIAWRGLILLACPVVLAASAVAGIAASRAESSATRGATLESAKLLLARGDAAGAERQLRELCGPEATFLLGKLLADQGRWLDARLLLQESLASAEHKTQALRLLVKGSMEHQDWESSCVHLEDLDRSTPGDPLVLKSLAVCRLRTGDRVGALLASQRALDLGPGDRELVMLMSEAAEAAPAANVVPLRTAQPPRLSRNGRRIR
jgi:tetratricopeptide (TPR) repeat protein